VRRRWTWVALSLLAFFVISMVITTILSVANGSFQQDPAGFLVQLVGFSASMVVGPYLCLLDPVRVASSPTRSGLPGWETLRRARSGWRCSASTVWTCLGAVVRQAEVIMAASAPAGGALVASRPVWTPVVAASETPDPAVQDGDPAQRQPQFLGGRQHQPRHHI
jgi:hypothetical protein